MEDGCSWRWFWDYCIFYLKKRFEQLLYIYQRPSIPFDLRLLQQDLLHSLGVSYHAWFNCNRKWIIAQALALGIIIFKTIYHRVSKCIVSWRSWWKNIPKMGMDCTQRCEKNKEVSGKYIFFVTSIFISLSNLFIIFLFKDSMER